MGSNLGWRGNRNLNPCCCCCGSGRSCRGCLFSFALPSVPGAAAAPAAGEAVVGEVDVVEVVVDVVVVELVVDDSFPSSGSVVSGPSSGSRGSGRTVIMSLIFFCISFSAAVLFLVAAVLSSAWSRTKAASKSFHGCRCFARSSQSAFCVFLVHLSMTSSLVRKPVRSM